MNESYWDPAQPASFGGVEALYRASDKKVSRKEIQNWLQGVDAYTLHKSIRHRFPTNRVIVHGIDQQWQCDLVDVPNLKKYNRGHRYILTCIDILSKYAWAVPLKQKRGVDITEAFRNIFQDRTPQSLQSDAGTEFKNEHFQKFLKDRNVRFFTTYNETKASIVERFNRTLKSKMWKYFTSRNTYNFIDILEALLKSYNHTFHRSIQRTPAEVNSSNERDVWLTLYKDLKETSSPCLFVSGDIVRISKHKKTFEKGYSNNWSEELFEIVECVKREHSVYRLRDLLKESITGTFYKEELQKVKLKEDFPVEKILKKRLHQKRFEYFVKYRGYPEKFNQWIPAIQMTSTIK